MRALHLIIAAALVATVARASAQDLELRNVRPQRVRSPLIGGGINPSWDGRLFFITNQHSDFAVHVFRPEQIYVQPAGTPWFFSGAFSPEVVMEAAGTPNVGMGLTHTTIAVLPAEGFPENPFRSDADGNPMFGGSFETYEIVIFTQWFQAPGGDHLGRRRARVVVASPRTRDATVAKTVMLDTFSPLTTQSGKKCFGIEPTLAFDGHLVIWQGRPENDGNIGTLVYATNENANAIDGWTEPRSIADLYSDRDRVVAGIAIKDRYPLAQQQLRTSDGQIVAQGDLVGGAYPWVTLDGSEVEFLTATKGFVTIVGRWTGWAFRPIDGPIQPDRSTSDRQFFSSPGASPSFWRPYRDAKSPVAVPYTAARPVMPLFGGLSWDYAEVSFEDHEDQDYVLALRMNEVVPKNGDHWDLDVARTPDTSGNFNTAMLEGARFSQEVYGADENRGLVGQAVFFTESDRVRVPLSSSLKEPRRALSVELFARRTADMSADTTTNRWLYLARAPGSWDFILENDGRVQASVIVNGERRRSGKIGPAIGVGEWQHVAFTYDGASGALRTFVGGRLAGESIFAPGDVDEIAGDLGVGPAADGAPSSPLFTTRDPVVAIDELFLSRVARTPSEIARAAFAPNSPAPLAPPIPLPLGLSPTDERIWATTPFSQSAADLGRLLFFDAKLSRDRSTSCSTCHDPARAFTDGRAKAVGLGGKVLARNAPSVVNRVLSTAQFWDGRAASLEEQALMPIENPDEMGFSGDEAAARLATVPEYRDAFARAFGSLPTRDGIARAIAAFERTIVSGDSPADRFENGDASAISDSAQRGRIVFRGRGRCAGCHVGSNFTDEAFHATAQTDGTDDGRAKITGRARDHGRVKTPSLRNVALTAPYLHDGSAATLADVIDVYDRGGKIGQPIDQDVKPLGLSAQDKQDLVAYLNALGGTTPLATAPPIPAEPKPGDRFAPALVVGGASATRVSPGASVTFTIDATDWDAPGTPASRFTLATDALPAGFVATFDPPILGPLEFSKSARTTLTITSPQDLDARTSDDTFAVSVVVANEAAQKLATRASVSYIAAPALEVSVTGGFVAGPNHTGTIALAATLRSRGAPLAGAPVAFALTPYAGALEMSAATTGADGVTRVARSFGPNDAYGDWSVKATATRGALARSASVTFPVMLRRHAVGR